ncbi:pyruvate kinase [Thermus albus]|uniref:pyruvate kinase n=1 Tax=Thermus albus TaxID=2908146 RepID=UPI001FAAB156|nr:pyruvate kinase [Thermus albus]
MGHPPDDALLKALHREIAFLRERVDEEGEARFRGWLPHLKRPSFFEPARNLADFLALRQHDLYPLQRELARLGLSSLGRAESRVRENLDAVLATLSRALGLGTPPYPQAEDFFAGEVHLQGVSRELFGPGEDPCILVTLPEEAVFDPQLVPRLVEAGMTAVRINLGHGHPSLWEGMVAQVRRADQAIPVLWLAEAASIPVIWATQVLDRLVKKGTPSRAEVSDAVLASRAECVMLNKGAFLEEAIRMLREVLSRIREHQYKKTPRMRRLEMWS